VNSRRQRGRERAASASIGNTSLNVREAVRCSVRTSQRLVGVSQRAAPSSHPHGEREVRPGYERRRPEESVLYGVVQSELESFLARAHAREHPVPRFVERELRGFLACGILAHGFVHR
jgi:hypothetical protein